MPPGEVPDADKRATLKQVAAIGAAAPFVALGDTAEASDTPDRREALRSYVTVTPGAHFSKLRDDLGLGTGETQYHLRQLVATDELVTERDGEYRRYFPANRFDAADRRALSYLRRETPRGIVVSLLLDPSRSASELAAQLDVSPPAISSAAADLEDAGFLDRSSGAYRLQDAERLVTLLVRYEDSFGPETADFRRQISDRIEWIGD